MISLLKLVKLFKKRFNSFYNFIMKLSDFNLVFTIFFSYIIIPKPLNILFY